MKKTRARLILFTLFLVGCLMPLPCSGRSEEEKLLLVGVGAFKDGFYEIAERELGQFVRDYPAHRKIYEASYLLGKTLIARGKFKEAKPHFSRIITEGRSFETMDYALFWAAQVEGRLGNFGEARRLLLSITKRFPKFQWIDYTYYLLGLFHLEANRFAEAGSFLRAASLASKREDLIRSCTFWLGVVAFRRQEYAAAIHYFETFLRETRAGTSDYIKHALFGVAEAQVRLGRYEEGRMNYETYADRFRPGASLPAISWRLAFCEARLGNMQKALQILQGFKGSPKDAPWMLPIHYLLGEVLRTLQDYPNSLKELNLVLEAGPANLFSGLSLISQYWIQIQLDQTEEAHRSVQRLLKLSPFEEEKAMIQWLHAQRLFLEGRTSDALPYYFSLMNTPYREAALFQSAKGYFFEKKSREAITHLDILLLEFPNSKYLGEALVLKAESLLQLGQLDQALETYRLLLRERGTEPWRPLAWAQIGNIALLRQDDALAEEAFQRIVDRFPRHALFSYAALRLGTLHARSRNLTAAAHDYNLVLKGNSEELLGESYFRLGEIFLQQGRYEKALSSFGEALRYFPDSSLWFFLTQFEIGNLQRRWNRTEEARRSYQNILDHSKDEEMKKAAEELLGRLGPK